MSLRGKKERERAFSGVSLVPNPGIEFNVDSSIGGHLGLICCKFSV